MPRFSTPARSHSSTPSVPRISGVAMRSTATQKGRLNSSSKVSASMGHALAGLAGAIEVAGRTSYVTLDMSPGYGYSGIVIAMLAALNPLGVVAAAIFVAGILVGADSMSRAVNVPTYIADVIVSVSLLAMLVATMAAQYRVVFDKRVAHAG